jgi:hypothetical protein
MYGCSFDVRLIYICLFAILFNPVDFLWDNVVDLQLIHYYIFCDNFCIPLGCNICGSLKVHKPIPIPLQKQQQEARYEVLICLLLKIPALRNADR